MNLFDTMERKQKFTFFNSGAENRFFLSTSRVLTGFTMYKGMAKAQKPFDIIRANIVIRSLANKKTLDEVYLTTVRNFRKNGELRHDGEVAVKKAIAFAKQGMPFLEIGEEKVFVPTYPKSLNRIYDKDILKLEEKPFKPMLGNGSEALCIDPFDTYGWKLFDSYFTNLILVRQAGKTAAFFDYDSLTIYFVNYQGRLDAQICLFDRRIGKRNTNHMMERITPVVDAYFRDDRDALLQNLVQNQLISGSLVYRLSSDEKKHFARIERKFG
ncbi:MAG: hypothetical protein K6E59_04445 [Bacilli bacterium]|nr:hypothetical protein [Bacilli bacterium]